MFLSEVWFRVFYRNGKGAPVQGEAELARALARKTPAVIYHETALIHRCQNCGHEGPWTSAWWTYHALAHHPENVRARAVDGQYIACSRDCFGDLVDRSFQPPSYVRVDEGPRPVEYHRALCKAMLAEQDRKRELLSFRKVPMPNWLGKGFCKWCNGPMLEADKPRTMWHAVCSRQFDLHTHLQYQLRYLRERDGRECAMPGCTNPGGEVDHRRPLWSVRHLPPMIRRAFYGPMNLWLLCTKCHAAKTKREAAERAAKRRDAGKA